MNKKRDIILWIFTVLCFALFILFIGDRNALLSNGKWDGFLHFSCQNECLILIDTVLGIFFLVIGIFFGLFLIKNYKWWLLLIPLMSVFAWFLIIMIHMTITYLFFM
jgi:hypothetical protein